MTALSCSTRMESYLYNWKEKSEAVVAYLILPGFSLGSTLQCWE